MEEMNSIPLSEESKAVGIEWLIASGVDTEEEARAIEKIFLQAVEDNRQELIATAKAEHPDNADIQAMDYEDCLFGLTPLQIDILTALNKKRGIKDLSEKTIEKIKEVRRNETDIEKRLEETLRLIEEN